MDGMCFAVMLRAVAGLMACTSAHHLFGAVRVARHGTFADNRTGAQRSTAVRANYGFAAAGCAASERAARINARGLCAPN